MTNRIHIDAPTGVIEVEGEKDFVEAQLDKLMPLIQACGFGTAPRPKNSDVAVGGAQVMPDTEGTEEGSGSESIPPNGRKRTRKAGKATPKGHSCADRMLVLRGEGYLGLKRPLLRLLRVSARRAGRTIQVRFQQPGETCSREGTFSEQKLGMDSPTIGTEIDLNAAD